jgi:hypothetical protein
MLNLILSIIRHNILHIDIHTHGFNNVQRYLHIIYYYNGSAYLITLYYMPTGDRVHR